MSQPPAQPVGNGYTYYDLDAMKQQYAAAANEGYDSAAYAAWYAQYYGTSAGGTDPSTASTSTATTSYDTSYDPSASYTSSYPAGPSYSGTAGEEGVYNSEAFNASLAAQSSIYTPEAASYLQSTTSTKNPKKGQARTTVIRKGGGQIWEDQSLLEWDPSHFRLFVGDLGNDVSDDLLERRFKEGYSSFVKSKVVRDNQGKTKGFGFVSYKDPEDFMKAWKEQDGQYLGSRPIKLKRATTQVGGVQIGSRKARELDAKKKGSRTKPPGAASGGSGWAGGSGAGEYGGGEGSGRGRGAGGDIRTENRHRPYVRR